MDPTTLTSVVQELSIKVATLTAQVEWLTWWVRISIAADVTVGGGLVGAILLIMKNGRNHSRPTRE